MSSTLEDDELDERDNALAEIRSMYTDGAPYFTKEKIRSLDQQLSGIRDQGRGRDVSVSINGLDGIDVDFDVKSPMITPPATPGSRHIMLVYVMIGFSVCVRDIQDDDFDVDIAYRNLRVSSRALGYRTAQGIQPMFPIRSHQAVHDVLRTDKQEWENTQACAQLKTTLQSTTIPGGITKIVGFSFGAIADIWSGEEGANLHHRSAYQHALLMTVRDIIHEKQGTSSIIRCYVQDPAYTDADRTALATFGITVLDDPKGFLEVDNDAVVISCAASVPVKQIVCDVARPALMLWERQDKTADENEQYDPYTPRIAGMRDNYYAELPFSGDKERFGEMGVFVRR